MILSVPWLLLPKGGFHEALYIYNKKQLIDNLRRALLKNLSVVNNYQCASSSSSIWLSDFGAKTSKSD